MKQPLGDEHGTRSTFLEMSGGVFVVRQSTASAAAQRIIAQFLAKLEHLPFVRELGRLTPTHHESSSDELLQREYVPGHTLGEVRGYLDRVDQFLYLCSNVQGFQEDVVPSVLECLRSASAYNPFELRQVLRRAVCRYRDFVGLRRALAHHYAIPLEGEGLRPVVDGLQRIGESDLFGKLGLPDRREDLASMIAAKVFGLRNAQEIQDGIALVTRRLGQLWACVKALGIYDMHHGNILARAESTELLAIDFECVGAGRSDALFPKTPRSLLWVAQQLDLPVPSISSLRDDAAAQLASTSLFREALQDARQQLASPRKSWKKRVLVAGTRDFEHIINIYKESLFFGVVLPRTSSLLDLGSAEEKDICDLPDKWRAFQVWKRFYRGLHDAPFASSAAEKEASRLASYVRGLPRARLENHRRDGLAHAAAELVQACRAYAINEPLCRAIIERVLRSLQNVPFRVFDPDTGPLAGPRPINDYWRLVENLQSAPEASMSGWRSLASEAISSLLRFEVPVSMVPFSTASQIPHEKFLDARDALERLSSRHGSSQAPAVTLVECAWTNHQKRTRE